MSLQRMTKVLYKATWDLNAALKPRKPNSVEVLYNEPTPPAIFLKEYSPPEFVHRLTEPAYIEPRFGYIITESGRLVMDPLMTTEKFRSRPWKYGIPSPVRHFRALRDSSTRVLHFPTVISLRYFWEWNYFHFYEDVLGKLALLDAIGVDPNIPVVLGKYANEAPFVRQIIRQGKFQDRNWIIPEENEYILADSILYGSALRSDLRAKYDYILSQMQPPGPFPEGEERIFLTRKTSQSRTILNMDAVEELLGRYGFRSVDINNWSIEQQMSLFAQTRFLIGIHGAGLTNLIFRQGCPLDIIELHGDVYYNHDYHVRAHAYGYEWVHLGGPSEKGDPQHVNFHVPLEPLETQVTAMLERRNVPIRLS